ncbi:phytanoyl-CoA dioxygenase family protein [Mollisia scopiformis]|uniref:Phytanoyl-CoA dioxygenase family protein n=1 Tax=Mollisia scopiformis TaxID=149040 RepID=A0A194XCM7_MOLSC|nr:phytanoyl-CoA dioxygenase family protein [Mollisia scopiformis]KUJ17911.1 phytanoyl-CoA dioxygenase family protein [Mollisia scopiformis]
MVAFIYSFPHIVKVSPEEKSSGSLSWKNLELATRALHHDGLVVLENAISHAKLDFLNQKMVQDALKLQSAGENSPYNYNKGNIQQDPPMILEFFDKEIFLNPLATQVTSSVLGPRPRLSFMSGNSALPPTLDSPPQAQPTHSDADFVHPSSPFALVVNVPLIDMTPENGSTEVWLGTHVVGKEAQEGEHGERASGRIKSEFLEKRREERPPSQPVVKKGSIVVRDLRLWHGGMPNYTGDVRVMLAMIHFAPWYRNAMQINFAEELGPGLESFGRDLQVQGKLMPEKDILDKYLKGAYGNAYDFNQQERLDVVF